MAALAAITVTTTTAPVITTRMTFETTDALVNTLTRHAADLPDAVLALLAPLRAAADTALDAIVTGTLGADGLDLVAA